MPHNLVQAPAFSDKLFLKLCSCGPDDPDCLIERAEVVAWLRSRVGARAILGLPSWANTTEQFLTLDIAADAIERGDAP